MKGAQRRTDVVPPLIMIYHQVSGKLLQQVLAGINHGSLCLGSCNSNINSKF